jgi:hypothetical protein
MRRLILTVALVGAAFVIIGGFASVGKAGAPGREVAVVEFPQTVKLVNVVLRGEYMVVHDEEKMAQGKDCTYFYQRRSGKPDKLIVSFHCQPIERRNVDQFTVVLFRRNIPFELPEVKEVQFAGSTEGHRVP